jgi:S-formylglutathione hydrolase FrmB
MRNTNSRQSKNTAASNQAGKGERRTGRVYYTQVATTPEGEPVLMGTFSVTNHPVVILFDSGASHTFISNNFVQNHCIPIEESTRGIMIQSPRGRLYTKEIVSQVVIEMGGHSFPTDMIIIKGQDLDVILGMNWLAQNNAVIDTSQRTI